MDATDNKLKNRGLTNVFSNCYSIQETSQNKKVEQNSISLHNKN